MCGGWVGEQLASIDPGPAIGDAFAGLDKAVGNAIPGGWMTVGALAATIATMGAASGWLAADAAVAGTETLADGTIVTTMTDGTVATTALDGSTTYAAADGTVMGAGDLSTTALPGADPAIGVTSPTELGTVSTPLEGTSSGGLSNAGGILGNTTDSAGNIIQTFDDGSTLTTSPAGDVISSTPATDAATGGLSATQQAALTKAGTTLAQKAASNFLSPATKALASSSGFKAPTTTGGLSSVSSNNTASTTSPPLTPTFSHGDPNYTLGMSTPSVATDLYNTPSNPATFSSSAAQPQGFAMGGYAQGGEYEEHNPSFFSEGGMENRYVQGDGDGTSDDVAAMLADGEFVIPADVVSRLGNGSSNAGAHVLDQFLSIVREDKNDHDPHELPPDSKGPLAYLAMAQKKA